VRGGKGFGEQRIVAQVDLTHREVIGGPATTHRSARAHALRPASIAPLPLRYPFPLSMRCCFGMSCGAFDTSFMLGGAPRARLAYDRFV